MSTNQSDSQQGEGGVKSVSTIVIETFLDELAKLPDMEDVSARLRIEMTQNASSAESALRKALFGEGET